MHPNDRPHAPTCPQDFIIQHEVKELGRHWLRCSADYLRADGERISFPRKYKFEVLNPLYVKIKVRTCMHGSPCRLMVLFFLYIYIIAPCRQWFR